MMKNKVVIKRIYEAAAEDDGYRLLVDRIWPRGVSKAKAKLDDWNKEIAPSTALRKWFGHQPDRFEEFTDRYKSELKEHRATLESLKEISETQQLCLLYGAKDETHNQAVVLKSVIESL